MSLKTFISQPARRSFGLLAAATLCACSGAAGNRSEWDNMDYSKVYRAYEARENDSGYIQPNVVGCINDDLYNCQ